jgi:exportin-7
VYTQKYKGIALCLGVLSRALSGNYVNFGVFSLYNDTALEKALDIALRLALSISLPDLMAFPKVAKSYFTFLEILFRLR